MHVGRRTSPWAWVNPFEPAPRPATVSATGDTTEVSLDVFLADLQRHLVERGWVKHALLHVADEPIAENVESWRALSRRVHAAAPRLKRIEAIQAPDFGRDLEIWVVELSFLRSEEHTSELQSYHDLVCRLLLEKKNPSPRTATA